MQVKDDRTLAAARQLFMCYPRIFVLTKSCQMTHLGRYSLEHTNNKPEGGRQTRFRPWLLLC